MRVIEIASRNVVSVHPDDTLDKAIALMEEFEIHHLPVIAGRDVVGIVSDRDILLAVGWRYTRARRAAPARVLGPTRIAELMSRPIVSIAPEEAASRAIRLMLSRRINALPIVGPAGILGIVTDADVLLRLRDLAEMDTATRSFIEDPVSEHMRAQVATVGPRDSLNDVLRLFSRRRIRHVPVVAENRLLGIISDRDVRRALGEAIIEDLQAQEAGELFFGAQTASDIMTRDVYYIGPTTTIGQATDEMMSRRIHCVPVVRNYDIIGILTSSDVLQALAQFECLH